MEPYRRPIEELPGDPRRLSLEYSLREPLSGRDDSAAPDEWTVSVRVERIRNRTVGGVVGSLTLYRLRQDERFGPHPWAGAEQYDPELFHTVLGCYDLGKGGYRQEFRDTVTSPDGDLLALTHVRLDPEWRGFGLGPVLASQALWTLAGGCGAVAVDLREAGLTALCEALGFRRRPRPLGHLLDPASEAARDAREEQRRRYDALVDAWRAAHGG
ncbi:hypothetical protein ACFSUJ_15110 [Streptomyces lusitanus]|uniref:GNAT family N-acetyltransferase n=1 Tax=Streptomyces lusitanus TaxID=68232 RepID=A0ABU3JT47_9ACTN|nr:hypothetical protein [Streptomyces lusitanus]